MSSPHLQPRNRGFSVTGPAISPKPKRKARKLYLEDSLWERLSYAADFHGEVFEAMGSNEKVSINDIAESFLEWSDGAYWADKGGRPESKQDRAEKVKRHA
jgi:hypothetical protein